MYTLTTTASFLVAIVVMTAIGSYDNLSNVGLLLYNGAMILLEFGFLMFSLRKEKVKSVFDALVAEIQRDDLFERERMDMAAHLIINNEDNDDDQLCLDDDDHMGMGRRGIEGGKDIPAGGHLHEKPSLVQGISDYHHVNFTGGGAEKHDNYPPLPSPFPLSPNAQKTLPLNLSQKSGDVVPTGDMTALRNAYRQAKTAANLDTNGGWGVRRQSRGGGSPFGILHKLDRNNYECESSITSRSAGAPLVYRLQMMNPFGNTVNSRKQKGQHAVVDSTNGITTTLAIPPHLSVSPSPVAMTNTNQMMPMGGYGNGKIDEMDENEDEGSGTLAEGVRNVSRVNEGFVVAPGTNVDSVSSPAITQTLSYVGSQSISDHMSSSLPSIVKDLGVEEGHGSPPWYRTVSSDSVPNQHHNTIINNSHHHHNNTNNNSHHHNKNNNNNNNNNNNRTIHTQPPHMGGLTVTSHSESQSQVQPSQPQLSLPLQPQPQPQPHPQPQPQPPQTQPQPQL